MKDYIVNNFLPEDHEQAEKELKCFIHSTNLSRINYKVERYEMALELHEMANRSYKVLKELRDKHDKAWNIIKRNEFKRSMDDLIQSQKVVQEQLVDVYD